MNANGMTVSVGGAPIPATKQPDLMNAPLLHWSEADSLTLRNAYEGILCVGATGSGKSSCVLPALLLPLLRGGAGALFHTTKTTDLEDYSRLIAAAGRQSSLRIFGPDHVASINLLETLFHQGGSRGAGDSQGVVRALIQLLQVKNRDRAGNTGEQFWEDCCMEWLTNAIEILAGAGERISFRNLSRILEDLPQSPEEVKSVSWQSGFINSLVDRAAARTDLTRAQEEDISRAVSYFLGRVPRQDDRLRSNVVATVAATIAPFQSGNIARLVDGDSNLSLDACWRDGDCIVLDAPVHEYMSGQLLQVLFKYVWQKMLQKRDVRQYPRPVVLVIDECQYFLTKTTDLLFTSTARAARCSTIALTQNLDVLSHHLGKTDAQGITGNLCTKIACVTDHVPTATWFAQMCGEEWGATASTNLSLGGQGGVGAGMQETRRFNLEPVELTRLRKPSEDFRAAEAVVFRAGVPFKASGGSKNFLRLVFPQHRK
jgi:hypothetical protein